jgi:O-antigen/teichoic acid export membrane protein
MSLARNVAVTTGALVVSRTVTIVAGIVTVGFASRYLGLNQFGAMTAAMAYASLFAVITDLGISTVATREIARNPQREREILGSAVRVGLAGAVVFAAAGLLIAQVVYPGHNDHDTRWAIAILLIQLACSPFTSAARAHFVAGQRGYLIAFGDVALAVGMACLTAVAVAADLGFHAVVAAVAGGYVAQGIVMTAVAARTGGISLGGNRAVATMLLRLGLPLAGTLIINYLYFRLDVLLLSWLKSDRDVAIYGVAYRVVEGLMVLPAYLMLALFPEIARLQEQRERLDAIIAAAMRTMETLALPLTLLTIVFSREIVEVVGGGKYHEGAAVLAILMAGVGVSYLNGVYGNALPALGRQGRLFRWSLPVIGLNLVLNLALIPPLGVRGAAIAVVASEVLGFYVVRRLYMEVGRPARIGDPSLIAAAAVMLAVVAPKFLIGHHGAVPSFAIAAAGGGLGLIAYVIALVGFRAVPEAIAVHLPRRLSRTS